VKMLSMTDTSIQLALAGVAHELVIADKFDDTEEKLIDALFDVADEEFKPMVVSLENSTRVDKDGFRAAVNIHSTDGSRNVTVTLIAHVDNAKVDVFVRNNISSNLAHFTIAGWDKLDKLFSESNTAKTMKYFQEIFTAVRSRWLTKWWSK